MYVAILQVDLSIERAQNLKEKRQVVRSVLARLRSRYNVSAAEVDDLDLWQRAGLGFCCCGNDAAHVRGLMQQVLHQLQRHPEARVLDHQLEVL